MTPYYDDGTCVIYHGDCLDVMPLVETVDMVFTSPPYNLGVTTGGGFGRCFDEDGTRRLKGGKWTGGALANGYAANDDALPPAEYEAWQRAVLTACWAQLSGIGAIFYNHKPRVQAKNLWTPLALNPGLPIRQIITWARGSGMNFAPTHFLPTYEWIIVFAKPDWQLKSRAASGIGDLWYVPPESNTEHPAPFPVGLPARAIEAAAPTLVLDPFMGSGSTLRAAKDANVRAIGIDTSERYCEIAANRLAQGVLAL